MNDPGLLIEGRIGPEGGALTITAGEHAGVGVTVPAGAVSVPTRFAVRVLEDDLDVPGIFPVYRVEPADLDVRAHPVQVSVRAASSLLPENGAEPALAVFRRSSSSSSSSWALAGPAGFDPTVGTLRVETARLGDFLVWNGTLHRLFTQGLGVVDPGAASPREDLFGVDVLVDEGTWSIHVGRGSLEDFWGAPAGRNVLILHGLFGSPLDFLGATDLVQGIDPTVSNIVLASYPSALGVRVAADALYQQILGERRAGFGCRIVAHSLGGLVARQMLERNVSAAERAGSHSPLTEAVPDLILLGVPHLGTVFGDSAASSLLPQLPADEQRFAQAFVDLGQNADAIWRELQGLYVDNPTRYHLIVGDLGGGGDGVVEVVSASALPLGLGETLHVVAAGHEELHSAAATNGVLALVNGVLSAP